MPEPIKLNDITLVGFHDGKPVIMSSLKPNVIFDTLAGLVPESDPDIWGESDEVSRVEVHKMISEFEWRIYRTDDAKAVFCGTCLPEQKTLPLGES